MSKQSRLDMYLQWAVGDYYVNTETEQELVTKFSALYTLSKDAHDNSEECNPANIEKWRKAYYGTLNALNQDGTESKRKSRQFRKLVYEFIESKIDNSIPMPKMLPRYRDDIPLVAITEDYLKFEVNNTLGLYKNDFSERATYIDGTSWYKVGWDSTNSSHERSGNVVIDVCTADQIIPQPGVEDYKQLEYIFEKSDMSLTKIYDLYGRKISPSTTGSNIVTVISCYYLNEDGIVGLFSWSESTLQVICNEKDWQIRKLRTCNNCKTIVPQEESCPVCGSKSFSYKNADEEILSEDLIEMYNPYDAGEETDKNKMNDVSTRLFATSGTKIPFYRIRQLPFVPRPAISSLGANPYGTSEVRVLLDMQDGSNKILTKAFDKTMKSGAVVTKPEKMKIGDTDETYKVYGVRSAEEASMVQAKQIIADTSQDILLSTLLYDSARSSSGVTESFQGKSDSTAVSGKAKQYSAAQAAGRIESLRVMKSAAFGGLYELVFKYLLAFSDEPRRFVKILPDGSEIEQEWNKYLFLGKDKHGDIYYRDDFSFKTDGASGLTENRSAMWQETLEKFTMGTFGNPSDTRTLQLFWNIMDSLQYPLAKVVLTGIKSNAQHLPPEIEQAIMTNPQLQQMIMATLQQGQDGRGGARPNSGPDGNGATHAANVERTNERNRTANKEVVSGAQNSNVSGGA